jgi:hypothetical protein
MSTDERRALAVANKFSCQQADEIRFSTTELVIDLIGPDGRCVHPDHECFARPFTRRIFLVFAALKPRDR